MHLLVQTLEYFDLQVQNSCSAILRCAPAENPQDRIGGEIIKATEPGRSWGDSILRGQSCFTSFQQESLCGHTLHPV